ncbi:hypothetical protein BFX83_04705 [Komagataeibacter xylinus]|nr:hypothetical protein BFX83_04705 [Komagataeibacter xylinus]
MGVLPSITWDIDHKTSLTLLGSYMYTPGDGTNMTQLPPRVLLLTGLSTPAASGAVLVLLYARGPLERVLQALPAMTKTEIALQRIAELTANLPDGRLPDLRAEDAVTFHHAITLHGVSYHPDGMAAPGFILGPVDLTIRHGEIMFITGTMARARPRWSSCCWACMRPPRVPCCVTGFRSRWETSPHTASFLQRFLRIISCLSACRTRMNGPWPLRHTGWNGWALPQGQAGAGPFQHHRPFHRTAQASGTGAGAC